MFLQHYIVLLIVGVLCVLYAVGNQLMRMKRMFGAFGQVLENPSNMIDGVGPARMAQGMFKGIIPMVLSAFIGSLCIVLGVAGALITYFKH